MMFKFFRKKYRVDFCGDKSAYNGAKNKYRVGEKVTLYYTIIATDTDYSFYLDGAYLPVSYSDKTGFVINFTMPDRDVVLRCTSKNTMINDTNNTDSSNNTEK